MERSSSLEDGRASAAAASTAVAAERAVSAGERRLYEYATTSLV
jgi:hypothetical protein